MGMANELVQEVLWWGERLLENTEEWFDLVQYHLGWDLPILLHSGYHDDYSSSYAIFWTILRILEFAHICSHLGMESLGPLFLLSLY